ncbi:MAG TPA: hypothetical protein VH913_16845 [Hyphomicrobiaceae bacterium]|jgi:hypothetical protein
MPAADHSSPHGTAASGPPPGTGEAPPLHPGVAVVYREIISRWCRQRREAAVIEAERARAVGEAGRSMQKGLGVNHAPRP